MATTGLWVSMATGFVDEAPMILVGGMESGVAMETEGVVVGVPSVPPETNTFFSLFLLASAESDFTPV